MKKVTACFARRWCFPQVLTMVDWLGGMRAKSFSLMLATGHRLCFGSATRRLNGEAEMGLRPLLCLINTQGPPQQTHPRTRLAQLLPQALICCQQPPKPSPTPPRWRLPAAGAAGKQPFGRPHRGAAPQERPQRRLLFPGRPPAAAGKRVRRVGVSAALPTGSAARGHPRLTARPPPDRGC